MLFTVSEIEFDSVYGVRPGRVFQIIAHTSHILVRFLKPAYVLPPRTQDRHSDFSLKPQCRLIAAQNLFGPFSLRRLTLP